MTYELLTLYYQITSKHSLTYSNEVLLNFVDILKQNKGAKGEVRIALICWLFLLFVVYCSLCFFYLSFSSTHFFPFFLSSHIGQESFV